MILKNDPSNFTVIIYCEPILLGLCVQVLSYFNYVDGVYLISIILFIIFVYMLFFCVLYAWGVSGTWLSILANMNDQSESSIPESHCHNVTTSHYRPYIPHNLPPVHTHNHHTCYIFLVYYCFTLQSIQ